MKTFEKCLEDQEWETLSKDIDYICAKDDRKERKERRAKVLSVVANVLAVLVALILLAEFAIITFCAIKDPYATVDTPEQKNVAEAVSEPYAAMSVRACPEYETGYRSDVPLSIKEQGCLYAVCEETGVDYELALAIIKQETNFRNVTGDNGNSYGYMQIQPRWHQSRMERLGVTDLMDAESNFRVGCDYLAELLSKYTVEEALTAYNSGSAGQSEYATSVMGYMEEYRWNG